MDDTQDPNLNTEPVEEVVETPEESLEPTQAEVNDPENQSGEGNRADEANIDEGSPLSDPQRGGVLEGASSSESTSSDVHEPASTGSEQSEESELENQNQSSESSDVAPEEPLSEADQATQDDIQSLDSDATDTNPNARWYVVHTYSGHENKVATALKQRVESEHLEHKILDVIVPTQDKIEIRSGKKATVKEKIFPGYILVKMDLDDISWLAVRTTQGVTGFVGIGNKPTPIPEAEVKTIVKFMTQGAAPTFKDVFMVDDTVKIVDGPFSEFIGKVDSVDKEHGKVRVLVSIFGRETPVELDFLQVQKL